MNGYELCLTELLGRLSAEYIIVGGRPAVAAPDQVLRILVVRSDHLLFPDIGGTLSQAALLYGAFGVPQAREFLLESRQIYLPVTFVRRRAQETMHLLPSALLSGVAKRLEKPLDIEMGLVCSERLSGSFWP